jgi:hypothetical protein
VTVEGAYRYTGAQSDTVALAKGIEKLSQWQLEPHPFLGCNSRVSSYREQKEENEPNPVFLEQDKRNQNRS